MKFYIRKFWSDSKGQDLVEYALAAGLLAVAAIATMTTLGGAVNSIFSRISTTLSGL